MASGDMLIRLVRAGSRGNDVEFRRVVETLAEEERRKQHHTLADRLLRSVQPAPGRGPRRVSDPIIQGLLRERVPERAMDDLVLPDDVTATIRELIEEQQRVELLRSYGMEPRHRILLVGPPGTGKTSLAEAIANELTLNLITPQYEHLIGSLLGETAERVGRLFAAVSERPCVLFLDELEVIAKERSDSQETGEVKRVVASLLLQLDALPSHVVVLGATNHPELLDRAVWRRFEARVVLPIPSAELRNTYFDRVQKQSRVSWGYSTQELSDFLDGCSFAEIEAFCLDVRRRIVLEEPTGTAREIVRRRLTQWENQAKPVQGAHRTP